MRFNPSKQNDADKEEMDKKKNKKKRDPFFIYSRMYFGGGTALENVESIKYLGITITNDLWRSAVAQW